MSAFISMVYNDRIEILADGATCTPTGVLIAKTDKIQAATNKPLAVVGRGRHVELEVMMQAIIDAANQNSVDDTIDGVADALEQGMFVETSVPWEIVIACVSESRGPVHLVFTSLARPESPIGPIESFVLYEWPGILAGGAVIEPADVLGITADDFANGLGTVAVPIFEAMRHKGKSDDWGFGEAYWIGAHLDHAVVSADGVTVARIHEWPDQLMRKIEP